MVMLKECRPCWFCLPFDLTAVLPGVPVLPGCSGQSDRSHCRLWNLPVCVMIAFLNPVCRFFSLSQDSWLPVTDIKLTLACLSKKVIRNQSLPPSSVCHLPHRWVWPTWGQCGTQQSCPSEKRKFLFPHHSHRDPRLTHCSHLSPDAGTVGSTARAQAQYRRHCDQKRTRDRK